MPFVVKLHISTFAGICSEAEHWYGDWWVDTSRRVRDADGRVWSSSGAGCYKHPMDRKPVTHPLSAKQAAALNKKEEIMYAARYRNRYFKGEISARFDSKLDLISAAKKSFFKLFNQDDLLLVDRGNYEFEAIAGPDRAVEAYNAANHNHQKIDELLDQFGYLPPIEDKQ